MRAAVARVDKSKVTERRLSRSFRFGREIAAVANSLLRLKGETAPVLGAAREAGDARTPRRPPPLLERSETRSADETLPLEPSSETVDALCEAVRAETAAGAVKVVANTYAALKAHAPARDPKEKGRYVSRRFERRSQLVVLCRSNASVFEAAEMIHGFPGATLGIVGGTQSLRLEQLMDVYRLATYACEEDLLEISDKYVATFAKKELAFLQAASEEERRARDRLGILRRQSQLSDDKEMQMKLGIVARLGSNLPGIVDDMIKRCVDPKRHESAHFLLSTAHKVKGLEYPSVLLWHDFVDVGGIRRRGARYFAETNDGFGEMGSAEVDSDEINLLYVAATRAKRELFLPDFVAHVHGGFSDRPNFSRRAERNVGYDAVGRVVQGGPGSVVALRALGYLGGDVSNAGGEGETPSGSSRRSRRRFRPAPVAEPAAQTQMDADRRERVGVNPERVSCCARRRRDDVLHERARCGKVRAFGRSGRGFARVRGARPRARGRSRDGADAVGLRIHRRVHGRGGSRLPRRRDGRVVGRPRGPRAHERPRGVRAARPRHQRGRRQTRVRHVRHARGVVEPVRVPGVPRRGARRRAEAEGRLL